MKTCILLGRNKPDEGKYLFVGTARCHAPHSGLFLSCLSFKILSLNLMLGVIVCCFCIRSRCRARLFRSLRFSLPVEGRNSSTFLKSHSSASSAPLLAAFRE